MFLIQSIVAWSETKWRFIAIRRIVPEKVFILLKKYAFFAFYGFSNLAGHVQQTMRQNLYLRSHCQTGALYDPRK